MVNTAEPPSSRYPRGVEAVARARAGARRGGRITLVAVMIGGGAALLVGACGDDGGCPEETAALSAAEVDLYRQMEVCASRVTGVELFREELPRVEVDPEMVECASSSTGRCVTTPAGQEVSGYYLEECNTISSVDPSVLYHEMMHPILCDVPDLACDPGHDSPVWATCLRIKQCPDGRFLLEERVCDGTEDCSGGEDELGCGA